MDKNATTGTPQQHDAKKLAAASHRFRPLQVLARWWWLTALVTVITAIVSYKLPEWFSMRDSAYESTVLVEIKVINGIDTQVPPDTAKFMNRSFAPAFWVHVPSAILVSALEKNDLLNRLGGNQEIALERIKNSLKFSHENGTESFRFSYRDEDPILAQDAVIAIYQSYIESRIKLELQMRKDTVKALQIELQNKSDRVVELRKRLMKISEQLGIIWEGNEQGGVVSPENTKVTGAVYDARKEVEQLLLYIKRLKGLDDEELIRQVAELPNIGMKSLYNKYTESQQALSELKATGLAKNHPDVQTKSKAIDEMRSLLIKRAVNVQKSLDFKLELINSRIKKLDELNGSRQNRGATVARNFQEFNLVRKEYQAAYARKDQLQARYSIAKTKLDLPPINHVVHEESSRSIPRFTLVALPLAAMGAFTLIYLAEAISPRRTT